MIPAFIAARLVVPDDPSLDFRFQLNPSSVKRTAAPRYADVPIALAGAGRFDRGRLFEWAGNKPEDIAIDFVIQSRAPAFLAGVVEPTVDAQLEHLDRLMSKSFKTGEPYDLVFCMGKRQDYVRITNKTVDEVIWNEDLSVYHAKVQLTMRTVRPRVSVAV